MNLKDVYKKFPTEKKCLLFLEEVIWNNRPICPYCKSQYVTTVVKENRHHCNTCNSSFSVTVNTIFHKTKCDLQKWFYLTLIFMEYGEIPSLRLLGNELNVTKDTAARMISKIKLAYISNKTLLDNIIKNLNYE
jgi:transposase-like protein